MSTRNPCATIGCVQHGCRTHAHCRNCRYLRRRAKAAGVDPDARAWRQLDEMFGRREVTNG